MVDTTVEISNREKIQHSQKIDEAEAAPESEIVSESERGSGALPCDEGGLAMLLVQQQNAPKHIKITKPNAAFLIMNDMLNISPF